MFYQILIKNLKTSCVQKERTKDSSHSEDTACSDWDEKNECHSVMHIGALRERDGFTFGHCL